MQAIEKNSDVKEQVIATLEGIRGITSSKNPPAKEGGFASSSPFELWHILLPICTAEHCRFFVFKGEDCLRNIVTSSAASQKIETHREVGAANQTVGSALGCWGICRNKYPDSPLGEIRQTLTVYSGKALDE